VGEQTLNRREERKPKRAEYYLKMRRKQMKAARMPRRKDTTSPGTESFSSWKSLEYSFFIFQS
jgi:hypothetical protein